MRVTVTASPIVAGGPVADGDQGHRAAGLRATVGSYIALTKPRIIELLLVTTLPVMILAANGMPHPWTIAATLLGGTLAAGSANTINCVVDRDIDAVMSRTKRRPMAKHAVPPVAALRFGIALGAAATLLLGLGANWLSAGLADGAIAFYVFVYTLGLKRRTPSNIVIGGAAGCFPVLIGWSAVRGSVGWPAIVLFAVVFLWTPPHFWALAMRFKDDYAAAGVPMLPVVAPAASVTRQIVFYSWAMVAASLALIPFGAGPVYAVAASVMGAVFLFEAHRLHRRVRRGEPAKPLVLFHQSITYLTVLFVAVAVSQFV
ncbi:MAG: protoheme IX farnesyltransferase [Frankiaceae bacterium]|nr:protoheme IX farnesyltransferase [Frankiaceae bacterium]